MYKIEKNKKDKSYYIEEISYAFKNRPDLYFNAYMALQKKYKEEGRSLFCELSQNDFQTLKLLLCFVLTQSESYTKYRYNENESQ